MQDSSRVGKDLPRFKLSVRQPQLTLSSVISCEKVGSSRASRLTTCSLNDVGSTVNLCFAVFLRFDHYPVRVQELW
jgi:hypothetical protein